MKLGIKSTLIMAEIKIVCKRSLIQVFKCISATIENFSTYTVPANKMVGQSRSFRSATQFLSELIHVVVCMVGKITI